MVTPTNEDRKRATAFIKAWNWERPAEAPPLQPNTAERLASFGADERARVVEEAAKLLTDDRNDTDCTPCLEAFRRLVRTLASPPQSREETKRLERLCGPLIVPDRKQSGEGKS